MSPSPQHPARNQAAHISLLNLIKAAGLPWADSIKQGTERHPRRAGGMDGEKTERFHPRCLISCNCSSSSHAVLCFAQGQL